MRGLFIGRFQPFHNGHMRVVEKALSECEELVIAIGSSQLSHSFENPFTAGERMEMIRRVLKARGLLERCTIVPIPDLNNNAIWVAHVDSLCPPYDVVYSNNPLVLRLFKEAGKNVRSSPLTRREELMGERIRMSMLEGEGWRRSVPKEVAEFLDEIKGVERLREICGRVRRRVEMKGRTQVRPAGGLME